MKTEATIEAQIETAWLDLIDQDEQRLYFLTSCGKLRYADAVPPGALRIRWFDREVSLAEFRARCFGVYEQFKRGLRGRA